MRLRGFSSAMYGTPEKSHAVVTALSMTGPRRATIEKTQRISFDATSISDVRAALSIILSEICSVKSAVRIIQGEEVRLPIYVVFGSTTASPVDLYREKIEAAFPEFVSRDVCDQNSRSYNNAMRTLIDNYALLYSRSHTTIETFSHVFHHQEANVPDPPFVRLDDKRASQEIDNLLGWAEYGESAAIHELEARARSLADDLCDSLEKREGGPPPFVVLGGREEYFQRLSSFNFLRWGHLKDVFVERCNTHYMKPNHMCVRTPIEEPAPPFADICATHFARLWDSLRGRNNGRKRHVFAGKNTR